MSHTFLLLFLIVLCLCCGTNNARDAGLTCDAGENSLDIDWSPPKSGIPLGLSGMLVNPTSGWGNLALHIVTELFQNKHQPFVPLMLEVPTPVARLGPHAHREVFARIWEQQQAVPQQLANHKTLPFPVLHGIVGNFAEEVGHKHWGCKNVAIVFPEFPIASKNALETARKFDLILAGSQWVVKSFLQQGLNHTRLLNQGVDTNIFRPLTAEDREVQQIGQLKLKDRFVVFSGGKLEFRKGQDIAVAAMRIFMNRHPDVVFLTAWHNHWHTTLQTLASSPHNQPPHPPTTTPASLSLWLSHNQIDPLRHHDLGEHVGPKLAILLRHVTVGIFPNRCEAGTNLVAMEAMACGVPVVLAGNTGHLDVGSESHAFMLPQHPLNTTASPEETNELHNNQWSDTHVDDLVDKLEWIYSHREEAAKRGKRAAKFIRKNFSWQRGMELMSNTLQEEGIACGCGV